MKKCYFSNRIYKYTLKPSNVEKITNIIKKFNKAKFIAYSLFVKQKYFHKELKHSPYMIIKNKFNFNSYFASNAKYEAESGLKSNIELQKLYIDNENIRIEHTKEKIKDLENQYLNKLKVRDSIIKISKAKKLNKKLPKFKSYIGSIEGCNDNKNNMIFYVRYKKKTDIYFNLWEFEYNYLVPKMKQIKNRIKLIKYGIQRKERKLKKLEEKPYFSCFGSKSFFKKQYTVDKYINNHELWKEEFDKKRYKSMQICGTVRDGNKVFYYNTINNKLTMKIDKKNIIEFNNIIFPYGQDNVNNALTTTKNRKSVAWTIEDHDKYYIFKCTIELPKKDLNYSKSDGVVSLDINVNKLAWTNLDYYGNRLTGGILYFKLLNKSSGQSIKIIENVINQFVSIAKKYKKPIVIEKLNIEKTKNKLKYGSKKKNRIISQFAYKKIIETIIARAYKKKIYVYQVNPAYTSQIGKFKYMRKYRISVHEAASYVIGRRCLEYKEKIIPEYKYYLSGKIIDKHHWSHWSYISKTLKEISNYCFYRKYKEWFNDIKDYKKQLKIDFNLS